jgi:hypothetical protein
MKIPYRDGKHHDRKGKGRSYLECLDSRWGVEEGKLGNVLVQYLPNWYFPLEWGGIWDKWCKRVLMELLR